MRNSNRAKYFWKKLISSSHKAVRSVLLRRPKSSIAIGVAIVSLAVILATPVRALQVEVTPTDPKLGDTISVAIEVDRNSRSGTPTVTVGDKNYQAFPTGSNTYRALLPTTPLEESGIRQIGITADDRVETLTVRVAPRSFPTQRIRLSGGGIDATQHELDLIKAFKSQVTPEKYWNGRFIAPNAGRISTGYGVRRYYNGVFAKGYYHRGVDYAGGYGSTVVAPAAGRVTLVGTVDEGFRVNGNTIGIDHGQGVTSVFLHLSRINVREGDLVDRGQPIGAIGSTGASTGPHLHWGLYVNGQCVDPAPWRFQGIE